MAGGRGIARELAGIDLASTDGEMQVVASFAGIAAGFGMAAGAHCGDAEWQNRIAQPRRLPGAEDDADVRKRDAQGADQLDKLRVAQFHARLKAAGARPNARKTHGELRLPALLQEVFQMGGQRARFRPPVRLQPEECSHADPAESSRIGALRAGEAPVKILLRPGGVKGSVGLAMIGLLIDDEAFCTGLDHGSVLGGFHRSHLQRQTRNFRHQRPHAALQVAARDEFRMLSGDEQKIAEAFRGEMPRFLHHRFDFERDAQDGILAGKTAIRAGIDALVGKIKRSKEPDGFSEMLPRQAGGLPRHLLELFIRLGLEKSGKAADGGGAKRVLDDFGKRHLGKRSNMKPRGALVNGEEKQRDFCFGFTRASGRSCVQLVFIMDHFVSFAHFLILLALFGAFGSVLVNLAFFRGLESARPDAEAPLVSILVPARNEAHNIAACVSSLLAQDYPFCEVLVLDDHSTDDTAEVLRGLGLRLNGMVSRYIVGEPLPPGWTGKSWACHQLARQARGEYLFFTDADTQHARGTVSALLACAKRRKADLVSAWPQLVTVTWSEKLIVPLIMLMAATMYPHWLVLLLQRIPVIVRLIPRRWVRMLGAANGQSMFFRSVAYEQIGGHAAIRGHIVEDVALGREVAARIGEGMRLWNCEALGFSTCRMYRRFSEVWEGFSKNVRGAFEESLFGFLFAGAIQILCFLLPCVLLFLPVGHRGTIIEEVALIYGIRVILTARFKTSWLGCALHPVGHALALLIGLNSWRSSLAGRVKWKGRTYSHTELPRLE